MFVEVRLSREGPRFGENIDGGYVHYRSLMVAVSHPQDGWNMQASSVPGYIRAQVCRRAERIESSSAQKRARGIGEIGPTMRPRPSIPAVARWIHLGWKDTLKATRLNERRYAPKTCATCAVLQRCINRVPLPSRNLLPRTTPRVPP